MRQEDESLEAGLSAAVRPPPQYATPAEVEQALDALSPSDYTKLMIIAAAFCRKRFLAHSVCEPKDLLHQAVLKTLKSGKGKRWNKQVSIIKHLDRAMENISGHLARTQSKTASSPKGLEREANEDEAYTPANPSEEAEKVAALLNDVFGDDDRAKEIFLLRKIDQLHPNEIQARLKISKTEYETVNRRILRKLSQHLTAKGN
jgi:DNA-directed RNA polymerase specialized sigma24 family protein